MQIKTTLPQELVFITWSEYGSRKVGVGDFFFFFFLQRLLFITGELIAIRNEGFIFFFVVGWARWVGGYKEKVPIYICPQEYLKISKLRRDFQFNHLHHSTP